MNNEIQQFNEVLVPERKAICDKLAAILNRDLAATESKIWHAHPVWFIYDNPIVGYSSLKDGIRLMFWSGADFDETDLEPGTGKFKDASIIYTDVDQVDETDLKRWLKKSEQIQWDYKNIYKTKGMLHKIDTDT